LLLRSFDTSWTVVVEFDDSCRIMRQWTKACTRCTARLEKAAGGAGPRIRADASKKTQKTPDDELALTRKRQKELKS